MFVSQSDAQGLNVIIELLNPSTSNHRENVINAVLYRLLKDVGQSNPRNQVSSVFSSDFKQRLADFDFLIRLRCIKKQTDSVSLLLFIFDGL